MSGEVFRPRKVIYHSFIWMIVFIVMVGATGCGQDASTPTAAALLPTGPADTATPQPTSTPVPTPTPTEIPIVLPTATPPNPPLPATSGIYQQPFTAAPFAATSTANATSTPAFTVTPYVPPVVNALGIYAIPNTGPYYRLDYIPPPQFSTSCIIAQHYPTPTPTPTPTPLIISGGQVVVIPPTPTPVLASLLGTAKPDSWLTSFQTRYFLDTRLNSVRIAAPTFTPIPTSTPLPTQTALAPLPFNTPDIFTGLTPIPVNTAQAAGKSPTPTAPPRMPTSTPSLSQKFQPGPQSLLASIFITDTTAALNGFSSQPINFVAMWQVMNDLTLTLANPDIPEETFLRAYERNLDAILNNLLNRSLYDPRLPPSGEQRYANRKIIIGNVPDLQAFRYFTPCFTAERIRQIQNDYNQLINREIAKFPGRVYLADLSHLAWTSHPQWVAVEDGLQLTFAGSDAVADEFGRVFVSLRF